MVTAWFTIGTELFLKRCFVCSFVHGCTHATAGLSIHPLCIHDSHARSLMALIADDSCLDFHLEVKHLITSVLKHWEKRLNAESTTEYEYFFHRLKKNSPILVGSVTALINYAQFLSYYFKNVLKSKSVLLLWRLESERTPKVHFDSILLPFVSGVKRLWISCINKMEWTWFFESVTIKLLRRQMEWKGS